MTTTYPTSSDRPTITPKNSALTLMRAQWESNCRACTEPIAVDAWMFYSRDTGPVHPECVVPLTDEEIAAAEAERKAERAAHRKLVTQARKERAAKLLSEPLKRYGHGFDSINSETCSRCGGGGYFPYAVYQGKCFKCHALGRTLKAQAPQPRGAKAKVVGIREAKVGDYIDDGGGTFYEVTRITWYRQATRHYDVNGATIEYNQRLHCRRLVDDARHGFLRAVYHKPLENPDAAWDEFVSVSASMHGHDAGKAGLLPSDPEWERARWFTWSDASQAETEAWDRQHATEQHDAALTEMPSDEGETFINAVVTEVVNDATERALYAERVLAMDRDELDEEIAWRTARVDEIAKTIERVKSAGGASVPLSYLEQERAHLAIATARRAALGEPSEAQDAPQGGTSHDA